MEEARLGVKTEPKGRCRRVSERLEGPKCSESLQQRTFSKAAELKPGLGPPRRAVGEECHHPGDAGTGRALMHFAPLASLGGFSWREDAPVALKRSLSRGGFVDPKPRCPRVPPHELRALTLQCLKTRR